MAGNFQGLGGGPFGVGQMLGQRVAPMAGGPGSPLDINPAQGGGGGMPGAQLPMKGQPGMDPATAGMAAGGMLGMFDKQKNPSMYADMAAAKTPGQFNAASADYLQNPNNAATLPTMAGGMDNLMAMLSRFGGGGMGA